MSSYVNVLYYIDDSGKNQVCIKRDTTENMYLQTKDKVTIDGNCIVQGGLTGANATFSSYMNAPNINPSFSEVKIATGAGQTGQGTNAVAIGNSAGQNNQGQNAIAIGGLAGYTGSGSTGQHANTIILNASGQSLMSDGSDRCYISPIRNVATSNSLFYNTSTKEVSYGSGGGGGTTITTSANVITAAVTSTGPTPAVNPTKGTVTQDFISVIDNGTGWCTCTMSYAQTAAGTNGTGYYIFQLPGSYQFNTTLNPISSASIAWVTNKWTTSTSINFIVTMTSFAGGDGSLSTIQRNAVSNIVVVSNNTFAIYMATTLTVGSNANAMMSSAQAGLGAAGQSFAFTFMFNKA